LVGGKVHCEFDPAAHTFLWPGITALVLPYFIAGRRSRIGIFEIVGAIKLRDQTANSLSISLRDTI
jgi:hypothetical protein